mmetsp:Transcript_52403/g.125180  ORF Transcript_52403/g.125180 Transcript_52403/m.125180 type:complete len:705 (-) Transcript_52403:66-2180(-)
MQFLISKEVAALLLIVSIVSSDAVASTWQSECDMRNGCYWNAAAGSCLCPSDSHTRINFLKQSYNSEKKVTTFRYGVVCPDQSGLSRNVTAWGLFTEADLVATSTEETSDAWTTDYVDGGRHVLASVDGAVQCPGEMHFDLALEGEVGACSGQVFSASTFEGFHVSMGVVPCQKGPMAARQAAVKDTTSATLRRAASNVRRPAGAEHLASTTETVTRTTPTKVSASKRNSVPASVSASPAVLLKNAEVELSKLGASLRSTDHCVELGDQFKKVLQSSKNLAAGFKRAALQGVVSEDADAAVEASNLVLKAFLTGIERWKTMQWCPKGVQGAMGVMQKASEDWTRAFSALGVHGLRAGVVAAQVWAEGLAVAGRTWLDLSGDVKCQQIPTMVSILNQMVTSARDVVGNWVELTEAFPGHDTSKVEVMSVWMTAFETLTDDARKGALAWSDVCPSQKATVEQISAASIALSKFVQHFSTQLADASQQWAKAFEQSAATAPAVVHASLLASSSFYISDLAQICHTSATSLAFRASSSESLAQASRTWADAFSAIIRDAQQKATSWRAACRGCDDESGSEATEAWSSFFEMISVSVEVAADGWLHSAGSVQGKEDSTVAWEQTASVLVQARDAVTQSWANLPKPTALLKVASLPEEVASRTGAAEGKVLVKGPRGAEFVIHEFDALTCNMSKACGNFSSESSGHGVIY